MQPDAGIGNRLPSAKSIFQICSEGFFAEYVFPGCGSSTNALCVELVRGSNQDSMNILALEQAFEASERVLDLQFRSNLPCPRVIDIGNRNQFGLRHHASQIFRMALAHFPHSQDPDP